MPVKTVCAEAAEAIGVAATIESISIYRGGDGASIGKHEIGLYQKGSMAMADDAAAAMVEELNAAIWPVLEKWRERYLIQGQKMLVESILPESVNMTAPDTN